MFQTYCTSYYGCPLWNLDSNGIKRFYSTWRKCVCKIWRVPPMTHGRILPHLYDGPCIEAQSLFETKPRTDGDITTSIVSALSVINPVLVSAR